MQSITIGRKTIYFKKGSLKKQLRLKKMKNLLCLVYSDYKKFQLNNVLVLKENNLQ